jgi:transcriptional regulator with XRE-family HTH domain
VSKKKSKLPTVRSRELGDGVRAAIAASGMGVRELAHRLGWSHPYISHLLSGNRSVSELELLSVLLACNVHRQERERLLGLAGELETSGWLQQYESGVPENPRTLVGHERKATTVSEVRLTAIPKLLQAEGYARATGEGDERVRARLARQDVFIERQGPRRSFYVGESALRTAVGDSVVMSEQLHHLLRLAVRPQVELRIVPAEAHSGQSWSFTLLEFATFDPVVYLEGEVTAVFLEQAHQIAAYRRILTTCAGSALNHNDSKAHIAALATDLHAGSRREGHLEGL